jgi:cephalosporin hydroxylase
MYSKMIKKGEYIVVMDTVIDIINSKFNKGKPFGKGNSPMDAVKIFLKKNKNFKIDKFYENKSLLTVARNGFLKKIK